MRCNQALTFFLCATVMVLASIASAATMTPYSSFGGGDGWLSPGEGGQTNLGIANNERGIAYANGHVYLASHAGGSTIRILDQTTGADLGSLDLTGLSGGTFLINNMAAGTDGAIYAANLTVQSTTSPFKIYRWATEGSVPTVAYSGDGGLPGSRLGDDLAMTGANRLAAGFNSTPAVTGNNGYSILDVASATATAVGFTGTPPNAGDFRLGLTFSDINHVLGTAGSSLYRYSSFSGSSGTLINSPAIPDPSGATADRLLAYTQIAGVPILAVQSIGDSHVTIYDVTDPSVPVYLASGNNTSGTLTVNGNGTGEMAWGATTVNGDGTTSQILYGMSTNQGIQAFVVTVPEPATISLLAILIGSGAIAAGRRRR